MNDVTAREAMWRRIAGDDWASFDALPPAIRRRLHEHAYDAWSVNALRPYESAALRAFARYERLTRWLLALARRPKVRRQAIRALARAPKVFEALLASVLG